ncbi:type II secretion system F family protein [Jatrophihabitans sp. DSM 45814]
MDARDDRASYALSSVFWSALSVALYLAVRWRVPRSRPGGVPASRMAPTSHRSAGVPSQRDRLLCAIAVALSAATALVTFGIVAAAMTGLVAYSVMRRIRTASSVRAPNARVIALLLDLIASALSAGAPPDHALSVVSGAVREAVFDVGRAGSSDSSGLALALAVEPLRQVGRLLELGAEPSAAWATLERVPGYEQIGVAGRRCANTGARLAAALGDIAHELRASWRADALVRAERVGIWSLLPLGLCFLPAFVCLGVIPVVIGIAGEVLTSAAP